MKKQTYYIVAAVIALCVAAGLYCWLRPKPSACEAALPREAKLVGRVNLSQLLGKKTVLNRYIGHLLAPEILKETGIDFSEDAYVFAYQGFLGAVVPLRNEDDFLSYATRGKHGVERQRRLKWSVAENSFLICSDGHKAMLIGPATTAQQQQLRNVVVNCMKQETTQAPTELLEKLSEADAVSLATKLGFMPETCCEALCSVMPEGTDVGGTWLTAALSLSDSTAVLDMALEENDKAVKKYLDQLDAALLPLGKTPSTFLKNNASFFLNLGVDGTKLLGLLRQNEELRTKLLAANMLFDLDLIVKSIHGQVSFASCDANPFAGEHLIEAQITDDSFMQHVSSWNEGLSQHAGVQFLPARNDCYLFAWQDYAYYFGTRSNTLFLTNTDRFTQMANVEPVQDSIDYKGEKLYATMDVQKMFGKIGDMFPHVRLPQRATLHMNDVRHWRIVVERDAE